MLSIQGFSQSVLLQHLSEPHLMLVVKKKHPSACMCMAAQLHTRYINDISFGLSYLVGL